MVTGALTRLDDGIAIFLRWPPANGGFTLGFNPRTALEIKQRGSIVMDGRRAVVRPECLEDDDERIDFYFSEGAA